MSHDKSSNGWYPYLQGVSPWIVFFVAFGVIGLAPVVVLLIQHASGSVDPEIQIPLFGRFFVWPTTFLLIAPLMCLIMVGFYQLIHSAIYQASSDGTLMKAEQYSPLQDYVSKYVGHPVKLVAVLLVAIGGFYLYLTHPHPEHGSTLGVSIHELKSWVRGDVYYPFDSNIRVSYLFYAACLSSILSAFVILNSGLDFLLWIVFLFTLTAKRSGLLLKPNLFHPDSAAGLSRFGRTLWQFYKFTLLLCLFVSVQIAEKYVAHPDLTLSEIVEMYPVLPLMLPVTVFSIIVVFGISILPLLNILNAAKQALVGSIAVNDRSRLAKIDATIVATSNTSHILKEVSEVTKDYETLERIPKWPFEPGILAIISASSVIPLFGLVLDIGFRFIR